MAYQGETPEDRETRLLRQKYHNGPLQEGTRREAPGDAKLAAYMKARGEKVEAVADALQFSYDRAKRLLKRPDVAKMIPAFRERHRVQTLGRTSEITPQVFDRMETALGNPDPSAVGQVKDLAKTVLDLERVAASASGELKPASTTIQMANILTQQQTGDPKQQLADLLTALDHKGFGSASDRAEGAPLSAEDRRLRGSEP